LVRPEIAFVSLMRVFVDFLVLLNLRYYPIIGPIGVSHFDLIAKPVLNIIT
jgi:hypothetical protein